MSNESDHADVLQSFIDYKVAYGIATYREDGHWVIDPSALYPSALFMRMQRSYGPDVKLESAIEMLRGEEGRLLTAVRLRID